MNLIEIGAIAFLLFANSNEIERKCWWKCINNNTAMNCDKNENLWKKKFPFLQLDEYVESYFRAQNWTFYQFSKVSFRRYTKGKKMSNIIKRQKVSLQLITSFRGHFFWKLLLQKHPFIGAIWCVVTKKSENIYWICSYSVMECSKKWNARGRQADWASI